MKRVLEILDSEGTEYVYRETTPEVGAVELAAELSETCDMLVAAGGDGTIYQVLNGMDIEACSLALLPFGSGNDIAQSVGLLDMTDEELARMVIAGKTRGFDFLVSEGERAMVHCCWGIVVDVIRDFKDPKNARKSYKSTMLSSVIHSKAKHYRVRTPNMDREVYADFVSCQNTATSGGGMMVTRDAKDDDGLIDFIIIEHHGMFRKFLNLLTLNNGKILEQPNVYFERTPWAEVIPMEVPELYSLDGELLEHGSGPLRTDVGPKQVRMVHP